MRMRALTPEEQAIVFGSLKAAQKTVKEYDPDGVQAQAHGLTDAMKKLDALVELVDGGRLLILDYEGEEPPEGEPKIVSFDAHNLIKPNPDN